jgi:hypothetical protein
MLDNFIDNLIALPKKLSDKLKPSDELSARVERYTDIEGVSTKRLNTGLWYIKHTKLFFLIVVWTLGITAAVLWSFALYFLADYLFIGIKQDRQALLDLTQSIDVVRYNYDTNFEILDAQALAANSDSYDLIGSIKNKNTNAWGKFSYYFLVDGTKMGEGNGFILPNEEKYLISLGQKIDYTPSKVVLVVDRFPWHRLNAHTIPSWEEYKKDKIDFAIRDKVFSPGNESGLTENLDINQLSFNVTNQTSFNYKQAPFLIFLYSGQNLASINRYTFFNFTPRKKESVNLTIIGKLPNITDIVVVPDINVLDEANFGPIE